eukprot:scaffold68216_cov19-Tisochrysis_lutea.AAC.1
MDSSDIAHTIAKGIGSIGGLVGSRWAGVPGWLGAIQIWGQKSEVCSDFQPNFDLAYIAANTWCQGKT